MNYITQIIEGLLVTALFILCTPMGWIGLLCLAMVIAALKHT